MGHMTITQVISSVCRFAELPVSREILPSIQAPPSPTFCPPGRMDLVITCNFQPTQADVTITHPNPASNQRITESMFTDGHFTNHRERAKINKNQQAAGIIGAVFIPLAMETYEKFGKALQSFLKLTATEYFNRSWNYHPDTYLDLKSRLIRLWTVRISAVLQRANLRPLMSILSRTRWPTRVGNFSWR